MGSVESEALSQVPHHLLLRLKLDLPFLCLSVIVPLAVLLIVWILYDRLMGLWATEVRRLRVSYPVLNRCWASIQWIVEGKVVTARSVLVTLAEH